MLSIGGEATTKNRYAVIKLTFEAVALLSGALIAIPTIITAAAYFQRASLLPQLVQFDSALGRHFLVPLDARLVSVGVGSLRVQPGGGRWPGLLLEDVWPDWLTYSSLVIDLSNTRTQVLRIIVRIDDRRPNPQYGDGYDQLFELAPLSRRLIRIPVAEIESAPTGSTLDLAHIRQ